VEPLHPLPYSFYCHHRRCLPEAAGVARRGTKLAGRKKFFSGDRQKHPTVQEEGNEVQFCGGRKKRRI